MPEDGMTTDGARLLAGGNPQITKGDGDAPDHEDDELVEAQLTRWFEQAAAIPGWTP